VDSVDYLATLMWQDIAQVLQGKAFLLQYLIHISSILPTVASFMPSVWKDTSPWVTEPLSGLLWSLEMLEELGLLRLRATVAQERFAVL